MRGISETSREAFAETNLARNAAMVLDVIRGSGSRGCISAQVQLALKHMAYGSITNHFGSLEDAGLITVIGKRPGPTGRNQRIYRVNDSPTLRSRTKSQPTRRPVQKELF